MRAGQDKWLSVHVFLADPVQAERYLRERLDPAIRRWRDAGVLDRWFFIRYWEGGPHLRIRVSGRIAGDEDGVVGALAEGIDGYRSGDPPAREEYYRAHSLDGRQVDLDELPWFEDGTVARIDYEPEITRYGGEHALAASETLFGLSSRIALDTCRLTEGQPAGRLSVAFALMAVAILASGEGLTGVAEYCRHYGAYWESRAGREAAEVAVPPPGREQLALLRRLEAQAAAGREDGSVHAAWGAGIRGLAEHLRELHREGRLVSPYSGRATVGEEACRWAVLGIVGSQVHMLNNRLGVPPAGERLLAGALARAAEAAMHEDAIA